MKQHVIKKGLHIHIIISFILKALCLVTMKHYNKLLAVYFSVTEIKIIYTCDRKEHITSIKHNENKFHKSLGSE